MKVVIKTNLADTIKGLEKSTQEISNLMPRQVFRALTLLEAQIKQNIRTTFNTGSGTLLNSVQKRMEIKGNIVEGSVGPENVPYAAIHEEGGTMPARFVAPRNKLALKWSVGNKDFFSKGHMIPSFEMPARPYIQPAIDKLVDKIEKDLGIAIEKELEKN